jgi:ribosomal protein S18
MKNIKDTNLKLLSHLHLQTIDPVLSLFLNSKKNILSRNLTGLNTRSQKKLKKAVKNARKLGLIPFYVPLNH